MNKNIKRILAVVLSLIMIVSLAGCASFNPDTFIENLKDKAHQSVNDVIQDGANAIKDKVDEMFNGPGGTDTSTTVEDLKIRISVLDVAQGLCVLVESDGKYMLYDGGDRKTSSYVVSYLQKNGVNELEYVVASHYDSDHIAGLVGVLETTKVNCVINPSYKATTKIYQSYVDGVNKSGAEVIYPSVGDTFTLGHATFTVLAPAKDYGDANENSVAIKITCGEFDCIITGDAEKQSEKDMLNSGISLSADVYIVGHHGSSSSSCREFVEAISPRYAIISCGKDNDYGHPHKETMDLLNEMKIANYRTDRDGEIYCESDGVGCAFKTK